MRPRSTRCSGTARRSFIMGIRLMPPASNLAPPPASATASSSVFGAVYSNVCGIILVLASRHHFPNLLRRERHVEMPNAQRRQRVHHLSLIHISEPTRQAEISYAVFCLKKKK